MLNRIRISTSLFLILILCGVLQIGSNGLSFWAFRDDFRNLKMVEAGNQQRDTLTQSRAALRRPPARSRTPSPSPSPTF